ncbi:hypothetical protein [Streptomyces tropicalis]|uniref:Translation initiation factor IF-2 n=1 Tax=Streptomyces tropicalis TaxID=3034234 RepID=A0ABT6AF98_9ACTN|nr:hypothetical protein [Streptomyces tropicalis]MDF3303021.1 hypothetical protein [Streptomyces tropicalis]
MVASSRTKGNGKNSATLARRKAAMARAAERMAERRREAEETEARRLRQEAAFDELVADFELAVEDETAAAAEVEEEIARVRERGQVRIDAAKAAAARVVLAMGEAGETVAGCGQRLGVGVERVKELRRLGRETAEGAVPEKRKADAPGKTADAEKTAAEKESGGGPGGEQQRGGGRGAGQADDRPRGSGAAPVAAPPVTAPAVPPALGADPVRSAPPAAPPGVPSAGTPAGPSGAPGGARPGWPESPR